MTPHPSFPWQAAPAWSPGKSFDVDDVVTLEIVAELLRINVQAQVAKSIAEDFRAVLRANNQLDCVHLMTLPDGHGETWPVIAKTVPRDAVLLWTIDVRKARQQARDTIALHSGE